MSALMEKRVDKPKFVKGVKPRLKPNPINERYKKNKGRAFVGAEYISDEEEEDEEKEAGVAGLAFSKPGSLFTYDYSKDYSTESSTLNDIGSSFMARKTHGDDSDDSPSSTTVGSCLMVRETKVMESPPSLSSVLDDEIVNQDEEAVPKGLFKDRCNLRGYDLVKLDFLMESLNERDESIEELESRMKNEKRRFNLLRQEPKNERCISQGLKQQIETFELDKVKDLETIERAQLLAQEIDASKKELEVAHASLTRDLDHLEKANKLVKDELKKLGENHDLLQETYKKALGSMNDPIIAENVASSSTSFTCEHAKLVEEHVRLQEELSLYVETNTYLESLVTKYGLNYHPNESTCEQATILEDNARLTKELAKFTTAKNKMGLDDLLNGKQLKKSHPIKSIVTTSRPLELLHLDLFGPSHYDTLGGSKYGLVIVDDYSRYSWVFLLKSKDDTYREFIIFAKKAQRMYESEIKAIRTDNGTEFKNYTMQEFVDDEGIKHEFSAPYTPQQNGVVERKNRTIIEMARTMLSEFNSPHNFWGEAISTVVHYSNWLFLRPLHNKTPYELLTSNKPNVMYIRVFGCKCLVKNNKGKLGKFETRTIEGTFVGYAENSHAYRYYNKSTGAIEVSCDVVFLEDNGSQVEQVVPCVAGDDDPSNAIKLMGIGHIRPTEVHTDDKNDGIEMSNILKNKKKALNALSKTMMLIKKHPQPMVKLKLSLMIKKFEMSMMGELKFFLGFQVRQLAKGTFISQEKYVKDMLKKFNMTNASPMKTPMPMKGQLGSCDGEKDVDIKEILVMAHVVLFPREAGMRGLLGAVQALVCLAEQLRAVVQVSLWDDFYNSAECMKNGVIVQPKAINKEVLTMHQATK
ncbi:hypothetical protein QYE76_047046 [Lolium multiflorum]|uniref:Integrase catalytic domain-containing protein n=1 Tax=Lolium multiflorum TaxID=4521 RepID=A0AAD8TR46_LOLMU|nr:hypothetical protein QYE76_047046 [Lolium multiflorum]